MALLTKYRERKKLGELLLSADKITQEQLDYALEKHIERKCTIGEILVDSGAITEDELIDTLCLQLNFERTHLDVYDIQPNALDKIDDIVALRRFIAMPYKFDEDKNLLFVAVSDPVSSVQFENIRALTNVKISFSADTKTHILSAIDKYYGARSQDYLVKQYSNEQKLIGKELKESEAVDENDTSESAVVK